jgi:hypothetical protein
MSPAPPPRTFDFKFLQSFVLRLYLFVLLFPSFVLKPFPSYWTFKVGGWGHAQPPHYLGLSSSNFYSRLSFVCDCLCFYSHRSCLTRFRVIELSRWGGWGHAQPPTTLDFRVQIFTAVYACFCFYSCRLCLTHFREIQHWRREGPKDLASPLTNFFISYWSVRLFHVCADLWSNFSRKFWFTWDFFIITHFISFF